MRERLKRAVLKTAVRETVPGVRIPLPPPLLLLGTMSCEHSNAPETTGQNTKEMQIVM